MVSSSISAANLYLYKGIFNINAGLELNVTDGIIIGYADGPYQSGIGALNLAPYTDLLPAALLHDVSCLFHWL